MTLWVTLLVYSALSSADFSGFQANQTPGKRMEEESSGRDLTFLWRPSSETCRQLAVCLGSWCGVGEPSVHWVRSLWVWFHWVGGGGWRTTSSLTSVGSSEIQTWVINQSLVVLLEVNLHEKLRTLLGRADQAGTLGVAATTTNQQTENLKQEQTTFFIKGQRCLWIQHRYYICTWLSEYVLSV